MDDAQAKPISANDTTLNPVTLQNRDEETKKKMEAVLAMEGEEGRLRRERLEKEKKEGEMLGEIEKEKAEINSKLTLIARKKEEFELKWIDLLDKKNGINKILDPIVQSETKVEKDQQAKNQEEHATDDVKKRQGFEKERQAMESERKKIEEEKWVLEDKVLEINALMEADKLEYQKVLKEEYDLLDRINELNKKIESIKQ